MVETLVFGSILATIAYVVANYLDGNYDKSRFIYGVCGRCGQRRKLKKDALTVKQRNQFDDTGVVENIICVKCGNEIEVGNGAY